MNPIVKLVMKYICHGISWGCTCLVFTCLIGFAAGGEDFLMPIFNNFAKHAIGSIAVGIACGSTAIIYQSERLSLPVKVIIHFAVGIGVFYPTALSLGWIPFYPDRILYTILQFLISCAIFAAIWFCFYLFNRSEAKKINNRLQELEKIPNEQDRQA